MGVGEMVVHVLPALKKYAGFENQDQKYFVLAFSVELLVIYPISTLLLLPEICPPIPGWQYAQINPLWPSFPCVVSEIKLKALGGLSGRLQKTDSSNQGRGTPFWFFPSSSSLCQKCSIWNPTATLGLKDESHVER